MHAYTHMHMHAYRHTYMHMYAYSTHTCMQTHAHALVYIHTCIHVHAYTRSHTLMQAHVIDPNCISLCCFAVTLVGGFVFLIFAASALFFGPDS